MSKPSKYRGKSYALTIEQSTEARALYAAGGVSLKQLAKRYEVHWETIRRAIAAAGETIAPPVARKLTDDQVADIRAQHAAGGVSLYQLSKDYGVSHSLIAHIVAGRKRKKSGE